MTPRYCGVFCPCGNFIVLTTHEVANPSLYGSDITLDRAFLCPKCDKAHFYPTREVAHSDWPNGWGASLSP